MRGALLFLVLTGCGAALSDLGRAEHDYEDARYEAALEWLEDLENHATAFDEPNRVRYFYLRGMTEYRLDHRPQALHYLALASEMAGEDHVGLDEEQSELVARTLTELTPTERLSHRPPRSAD
jgi:hypothetical protein